MSDELNTTNESDILYEVNDINSYSFTVEENKRPDYKKKLKKKSPDEILKKYFEGENSWTIEKDIKLLNYSFETGENNFSQAGDTPLIEGYRIAYLNHFPIVINPSHFWLMILQGFARHMEINDNSERNRNKFVNFEGKKNISFETGINLFTASEEQWISFIEDLLNETTKILEQSGKDLINLFKNEFSTSTREAKVANNLTILSLFKKYFEYSLSGTCGVSKIIIEGKIEDWELLLEKIKAIGNFDEEIVFWTNEMIIIIKKIIETIKTKRPDKNFFKNIVQNTDRSRECKPDLINGWIIKFIPYDINGKKCDFNSPNFNGLEIFDIPSQITSLPFNLINKNKKGKVINYKAEFFSGFFGVLQNKQDLSIRPVIGYAIVEVKNKKEEEIKEMRRHFELMKLINQNI